MPPRGLIRYRGMGKPRSQPAPSQINPHASFRKVAKVNALPQGIIGVREMLRFRHLQCLLAARALGVSGNDHKLYIGRQALTQPQARTMQWDVEHDQLNCPQPLLTASHTFGVRRSGVHPGRRRLAAHRPRLGTQLHLAKPNPSPSEPPGCRCPEQSPASGTTGDPGSHRLLPGPGLLCPVLLALASASAASASVGSLKSPSGLKSAAPPLRVAPS